jgi:uncharacterized hydrophobic protein (TIGR00271 family)
MRLLLTRCGIVLHGGPVGPADLEELEHKLYFDREPSRDPYIRFAVLLVLSVLIATGGVLADSTATVIGAMIVAPLMTPIMATGLSMVTGDQHHVARSLLLVAAGILTAVGISAVLGWLVPGSLDITANSQIQARISPRGVDLMVALASGAAGAFALSRKAVGDALPGVAIAISLVPPLCVVGVCLSAGDLGAAGGAALLFSTNFVAILVAGGGFLALMGYGAVARRGTSPEGRRRAALVTGIATVAVAIPLVLGSARLALDTSLEATARSETQAWLDGTDYELVSVTANDQTVSVTIDGSGPMPSPEALADAIGQQRPGTDLLLRVVQALRLELVTP